MLCGCSGERGSGEVDLGKLVSGVGPFCWMMMLVSVKKKETGKREGSEGGGGTGAVVVVMVGGDRAVKSDQDGCPV